MRDQVSMFRVPLGAVAEERVNSGKAGVPSCWGIASVLFEVLKDCCDGFGRQVREIHGRGRDSGLLLNVGQAQLPRVTV